MFYLYHAEFFGRLQNNAHPSRYVIYIYGEIISQSDERNESHLIFEWLDWVTESWVPVVFVNSWV